MLSVEERLKRAVFKACLDRLRMPDESPEHLEHLLGAYACMGTRGRQATAAEGDDPAPKSKAELVAAIGGKIRDFVRMTDGGVLANLSGPNLMGLARLMDPDASWPKSKPILVMALQAEHTRRDPPPPRSDPVFVPHGVVEPPAPRVPRPAAAAAPVRRVRSPGRPAPAPAVATTAFATAPVAPAALLSAIDRAFGCSVEAPAAGSISVAGDGLVVADGPSVRVAARREAPGDVPATVFAPAPIASTVSVERAIHNILQALGAITVDVLQKRVAKTSPEHRNVTADQIRTALEVLQAQDAVMVEHGIVYATS
jgi:hypothetical protein